MRALKDSEFKNKKVLVRCDFNVPLSEKGVVLDDYRIKQTIPTIEYLIGKGAKVILMSHLDDPKGKIVENLRLGPIQNKLGELISRPITKTKDCIGKEIENLVFKMKPGEIILLENLRFHKKEEEGDLGFAKELSRFGDIFVNEAFSCSHRNHASIAGIPKYLPSVAGLLLEKEIEVLSRVLEKPRRPLVAIIGGIKIETKIKLIEQFLEKADHLLLGSKPAESILAVKGILIGRPLPEKKILEKIEKINLVNPRLHLPIDGQIALPSLEEKYLRVAAIGTLRKEEEVFDVGPETIKVFVKIIKPAKMIIWSGPLGMFEKEPFDKGTREIAEEIAKNYTAFKIAGGGDTISAINKFGLRDKFDHVSTGGGAMLEFLAGEKLPGLEVLRYGD